MPMYEFRCRDCGERFEELRSVNDPDAGVECPSCGGGSCGPRGFS